MTKIFLALLASVFLLFGCASSPKYNTLEIKEKEVIKIKIDEELLTPCVPAKPISKKEYLELHFHQRELYLANYIKELFLTINDCNVKLKKIKEFQEKQ